jgi:hypothetical protein
VARRIAEIAETMRKRGLDPSAVAHFLDRIVFCLFAEDAGLLPDKVFSRMLEKSGGDPARFGRFLEALFESMAAGGDFGLESIRHFNGNLFDDKTVLDLTPDDVKRIAAAAALDWSAVDPSIFGTLFERGLDPAKRSQLGAHFTSREDIERVVGAVVMAVLRREWDETREIIDCLLTTGKKKRKSGGGGGREEHPSPPGSPPGYAAIADAANMLNALRENWLNPPEWTRTETLEFPGTVGGPWDRYIDPATIEDRGAFKVGAVRYPRLVARDADCAVRLKDRTLTNLYNARPT